MYSARRYMGSANKEMTMDTISNPDLFEDIGRKIRVQAGIIGTGPLALLVSYRNNPEFSDVTVLVGPEEVPFKLHSMILCSRSDFFKAALKAHWIEGEKKIIKLPEMDPKIFEEISKWLYYENILIDLEMSNEKIQYIVDLIEASEFLQMKHLEEEILFSIAHKIQSDDDPETFGVNNGEKLEDPLAYLNKLCLARKFNCKVALVTCAAALIGGGKTYGRGALMNEDEPISELWLRCYSQATSYHISQACDSCNPKTPEDSHES